MHFMVTQGIRDRETLQVKYPPPDKQSPAPDKQPPAGEVNPAAVQLDFYIRSPKVDQRNYPTRQVFDHFFAMQVTWK